MTKTEDMIIDNLSYCPVRSTEFEVAAKGYIHIMSKYGEERLENIPLGIAVQAILARRFGETKDTFSELVSKLGPHTTTAIFWFSIEDLLEGIKKPVRPPNFILEYLRDHLAGCSRCYYQRRNIARTLVGEVKGFDQLFHFADRLLAN